MRVSKLNQAVLAIFIFLSPLFVQASDELQGIIFIETRILPFDPVSGMKSTQKVYIFLNKEMKQIRFESEYETGNTYGLPAVRNRFKLSDMSYNLESGSIVFTVSGQTASGVLIMPDIDYNFILSFDGSNRQNIWKIEGCHDGYPAYRVWLSNAVSGEVTELYEFRHKPLNLLKLLGNCDVKVDKTIVNSD